jgi:predicted amidohydrolase
LTVLRLWGRLDDSRFVSDSRLAYIDKRFRNRWDDRTQTQRQLWNNALFAMARGIFTMDEHVVGAMFHGNVPMMAGTDPMNPYCFPGFSLHDELALLTESGLPPLAAPQAATLNPTKFMGRSAEQGTVDPGKVADLVLLAADPLADIRNTTQIQAVWLKGKYFDKAALTQMLEKVKAATR